MLMDKAQTAENVTNSSRARLRRARPSPAHARAPHRRASNADWSSTCELTLRSVSMLSSSSARMPTDKAPDCGERDELVAGAIRSNAAARHNATPPPRINATELDALSCCHDRYRCSALSSRHMPMGKATDCGERDELVAGATNKARCRRGAGAAHSPPRIQHGPQLDM